MRKLLPAFFVALLVSARALAVQPDPPALYSAQRILWAAKCAGPMPPLLIASLAAICVLVVISVIYYRKAGGSDER